MTQSARGVWLSSQATRQLICEQLHIIPLKTKKVKASVSLIIIDCKRKIKNLVMKAKRTVQRQDLRHHTDQAQHDALHVSMGHLERKLIHEMNNDLLQDLTTDDQSFLNNLDQENNQALEMLYRILDEPHPEVSTTLSAAEISNNHDHDDKSHQSWHHVARTKGINVFRRYLGAGSFVNKIDAMKGSKHACVKSTAIIHANAEKVFDLFLDINRAKEYNDHISSIKDLYLSGPTTSKIFSKISYATGHRMGPFKARDFVSVVNFIRQDDNSYIILNRPAYLSKTKPSNKFVRATILLGGNIIKPLGPNKTALTLVAHVNPGGGADTKAAAWIINQLCAVGPPTFIRKLETAANIK